MAALETPAGRIKLLSVAENSVDQAYGLKYVRELADDSGMLFKFQSPKILSFWNQDVYIPLDIAFIDMEDRIVKTERMIPLSLRSVTSGRPCIMALEVAAGSLEKAGASVGKKVRINWEDKSVTFDD
jgi:uncharacterized membrane protein (UPF0127 family)